MHRSSAHTLKHASQGKCVLNVLMLISSLRGYRRSSYLGCVVHNKLVSWLTFVNCGLFHLVHT